MKKVYLFLMLIVLSVGVSQAQIRHVKGIKSVDASFGISGYGQLFNIGYVKYTAKKTYLKTAIFYENGNSPEIKYRSFGLDFAVNYTVFKATEGVYINVLAGVTSSSDALTESLVLFDESGATKNENFGTLKFGVFGGIETEFFINDRFVALLNFNQRLMLKENFGSNRYFINLGVRYNF